ncbi:hypothetical protein K439DRAFT_1616915 [Ramaria rubella]|nr:hypothetical protein K439DRAFT_1616915 [Ramaria rubella]
MTCTGVACNSMKISHDNRVNPSKMISPSNHPWGEDPPWQQDQLQQEDQLLEGENRHDLEHAGSQPMDISEQDQAIQGSSSQSSKGGCHRINGIDKDRPQQHEEQLQQWCQPQQDHRSQPEGQLWQQGLQQLEDQQQDQLQQEDQLLAGENRRDLEHAGSQPMDISEQNQAIQGSSSQSLEDGPCESNHVDQDGESELTKLSLISPEEDGESEALAHDDVASKHPTGGEGLRNSKRDKHAAGHLGANSPLLNPANKEGAKNPAGKKSKVKGGKGNRRLRNESKGSQEDESIEGGVAVSEAEEQDPITLKYLAQAPSLEDMQVNSPSFLWVVSSDDPVVLAEEKPPLSLGSPLGMEEDLVAAWVAAPQNENFPWVKHHYKVQWPLPSRVASSSENCMKSVVITRTLARTGLPYDIHIVPNGKNTLGGFDQQTCEKLGIDISLLREVHEGQSRASYDYHQEMWCGCIKQLLDTDPSNVGHFDVNFLSVPLPMQVGTSPAFLRRLLVLDVASQQYCSTPLPMESLHWALVATMPAMSPIHRDAGKFAMFLRIVAGMKMWLLREPAVGTPPDHLIDMDPLKFKWTALILEPGHMLIMRPGAEHIVYTLQNCITEGEHFYAPTSFTHSLTAGVKEHLFGRTSTNTEHLASETIFHRAAQYYSRMLCLHEEDPTIDVNLPDDDNLAALITMVMAPESFEPQETRMNTAK